jgi:hypothetical protein
MFSRDDQSSLENGKGSDGVIASPSAQSLGALFSEVYGTENNCTSGIAMFMVCATADPVLGHGRTVCHY